MKVLWLNVLLLLVLLLVLADVHDQVLNDVLWLEKGLVEVVLISNELDWIVVQSLDVFFSHI